MNPEIVKSLVTLGGEVVIACMALWVFYKLGNQYLTGIMEAMQTQASAMQTQAACLVEVKNNLSAYIAHDNNDHREILLSLQVVIKEVQQLGEEVKAQGEIIQSLRTDDGALALVARKG